jgi:cyclase
MQSRNFRLQKVGNLEWLERNYKFQRISFSLDELIVINATRGEKYINKFATMISNLVNDVFIPLTAGGGIRSMQDAELLFNNGADKILINSALIQNINLVNDLVQKYGSQSLVASVDYRNIHGSNKVFINDGSIEVNYTLEDYIKHIESLNIGEIYLNSIDKDGTGFGYDFELISKLSEFITKPLIISGGAGNERHLIQGLNIQNVSAVATANLFNFIGDGLPIARNKIIESGENLALWLED